MRPGIRRRNRASIAICTAADAVAQEVEIVGRGEDPMCVSHARIKQADEAAIEAEIEIRVGPDDWPAVIGAISAVGILRRRNIRRRGIDRKNALISRESSDRPGRYLHLN